jgi:hypothetical protein
MPQLSLTLTHSEIQEAVQLWVGQLGYQPTDRFRVMVQVDKGDRGDGASVLATVTGVWPPKAP